VVGVAKQTNAQNLTLTLTFYTYPHPFPYPYRLPLPFTITLDLTLTLTFYAGDIQTPGFVSVATNGALKAVSHREANPQTLDPKP
jgi:hypothetical protein